MKTEDDDFDIYGDSSAQFDTSAPGGDYGGGQEEEFPAYDETKSHARVDEGGNEEGGEESKGYTQSERSNANDDDDFPETPAIYIGNLSWWTTDQLLEDLLSKYGKIKTLKFFEDKVNGKSKGYAFIEFYTMDPARIAKEQLQNKDINGKPCIVNYVSPANYRQLTTGGTAITNIPPPFQGGKPEGGRPYQDKGRGRGDMQRGGKPGGRGGKQMPPFGQFPPGGRGGYVPGPVPPGAFGRYPPPRYPYPPAPHVNPAFFAFNEGGPGYPPRYA